MADYQLQLQGYVVRRVDGAWIPPDPNNTDYQEYLVWEAIPGNDADPAPGAATAIVSEIASYQFWAQAAILGKITETAAVNAMNGNLPASIDGLIAALPIAQRFRARMLFRGATFKRAEPLVAEKVRDTWVIVVDDFFRDAALL
jgi:hypothetical protein